ncbi:J domain-containing protein [Croceicoccus marinus]|uniref:Molecular chaperone DnaJ n=1 Tax=Croceicoccus marinus TaxID=450378 RepID=A0A1Z1FBZ8_9SPHN|nr:J domain-containing protein [Croceicoccus marinus]ARU16331.1 molecular chaperone DnaJ [Croceicoccus marinus]
MARSGRSMDWGFPRWRGYEAGRDAQTVKLCDRHGCEEPGNCPAPKSPNNPDRWYFCEKHAAEYNRGWDYFAGLDAEEAAARAASERSTNAGYKTASHYGWGGSGDGSRSKDEINALDVLELEYDVDFAAIKKAWRSKAKEVHPDVKPGDEAAAREFHKLQLAYEVLRAAEERRSWHGHPEG